VPAESQTNRKPLASVNEVNSLRYISQKYHNLFNDAVMALDKSFESSKGLMM
jgi:hypothetical protein